MGSSLNTLNTLFFIALSVLSITAILNRFVFPRVIPQQKNRIGNKKEQQRQKHWTGFQKDDFVLSTRAYNIILISIIVIGVVIRVWRFGAVPGGFNQDGAMAAVDGKALADYGTDRFGTWLPAHLYAWGYGQMSSLLSYLIAVFVKIFGLSPITARLPQLLASLMGGVFFFLFVKDVFGKGAGLIAAAFVAIDPWHLLQSRWALDCNLLPHFFMGGLYFLHKGLVGKKKFVYISMIFFGLCMYCYGITIYTIPAFLAAAAVYYIIKKRLDIKTVAISVGVYLLIAWPFLLTMMVNFFKWDTIKLPFVTIQCFSDSVRSNDILLFSDQFITQLGSNFRSLMNTTFLQKKDLPWNDIAGFGTTFLCSMPLFIAGIAGIISVKSDGVKSLAVFAILTGVWAGLLTNNVNVNRINIIYYGVMMFEAVGIYFVITELKYSKWAMAAIYAVLGIMLVSTYFTSYADEIGRYFYYGFGDALAEAEDSGAERIYVTADAQGKGYRGTSEIITMFYDKTDAKYFQGKTNVNNGRECWPYDQRFIYESMSAELAQRTENEDAAYVIMDSDRSFFDESEYMINEHGNFCSVVKR